MKIEVKERGTRSFYDEFLYIAFNYRSFRKRPHKRAYRLTSYLIGNECFVLLAIILFALSYKEGSDVVDVFLMGMFAFLFIYILFYLIITIKRIKSFMNTKGSKTINITEYGIEYSDEDKTLKLAWNDTQSVIISKYSICFLPKVMTGALISVTVNYKDEIIKCLRKYQEESLLADNSSLYKGKK